MQVVQQQHQGRHSRCQQPQVNSSLASGGRPLKTGRYVVVAGGEIGRHGGHVLVLAHLEDQRHANFSMKLDVAVEEPVPGIVGHKANNRVAAVGHCHRVLLGCAQQPSLELALLVQLLDRLQIHARVQAFHSDDSERVAVQVEGMVRVVRVSWWVDERWIHNKRG